MIPFFQMAKWTIQTYLPLLLLLKLFQFSDWLHVQLQGFAIDSFLSLILLDYSIGWLENGLHKCLCHYKHLEYFSHLTLTWSIYLALDCLDWSAHTVVGIHTWLLNNSASNIYLTLELLDMVCLLGIEMTQHVCDSALTIT